MSEKTKGSKFKAGDEFIYAGSKNAELIWLTYVAEIGGGAHRLFCTENPTLEYHIHEDLFEKGDSKKFPKPEIITRIIAMAGDDSDKRSAYNTLALKMGLQELQKPS